jgi:hypothetical protein
MIINQFHSSLKYLQLSLTLIADSEAGGQMLEIDEIQEKIKVSKNRRIPVVKLFLVFIVIAITIIVLEYFI